MNENICTGARVRMISDCSDSPNYKEWYPPFGTLGTVDCVNKDGTVAVFWDCDVANIGVTPWYCWLYKVEVIG